MKGLVLLLHQLLPDVNWEQLSGQIKDAQQNLPVWVAEVSRKINEVDARLARIEAILELASRQEQDDKQQELEFIDVP